MNGKEDVMNALIYFLLMVLIRLVIPFGLILLIGEWLRVRQIAQMK